MRFAFAIGFALVLALAASSSAPAVQTGTDEMRAGMCDAFDGLPFVFCVAMCEARECDRQDASDARCAVLARAFSEATGGAAPPCVSWPAHSGA